MERREISGLEPSLLGYGGMRYPLDRETKKIDREKAADLIRRAMEAGINYYDTAWTYHEGESESFLGQALKEYPRESYYLATKLPCWLVDSREKAEELFHTQLERLDRDYVDFYLLHSLSRRTWTKMVELKIPSLLEEYQRQGKIRKLGFSFHDDYEVFEEILRFRHWDFCQIQLNYMDTEHQAGLKVLELARGLGVPVVVMEPVKGGLLAKLPEEVAAPLRVLDPEASDASWALRWVASRPGAAVLLSGMTTMEQLEDNLATLGQFRPLCPEEEAGVDETTLLLKQRVKNGCTGCRYCMPCPAGVDIPESFRIWNSMGMYENQRLTRRSWKGLEEGARPANCVGCGRCEELCPQHIFIRRDLVQVTAQVEEFIQK